MCAIPLSVAGQFIGPLVLKIMQVPEDTWVPAVSYIAIIFWGTPVSYTHLDVYKRQTCNCGNTFVTGSTKPELHVEVCSKGHPFYTGQQKAAQARGRIDKFNKKYGVGTAQN